MAARYLTAAALLACGCGGPPSGPDVESLRAIFELTAQYSVEHGNRPPGTAKQFRAYLDRLSAQAAAADRAAPTDPTAEGAAPAPPPADAAPRDRFARYLTSTRDGQPFVIRHDVPVSFVVGSQAPAVLARETTGVGGRVLAVFADGTVDYVPAE